jgi:hypothetical protein
MTNSPTDEKLREIKEVSLLQLSVRVCWLDRRLWKAAWTRIMPVSAATGYTSRCCSTLKNRASGIPTKLGSTFSAREEVEDDEAAA